MDVSYVNITILSDVFKLANLAIKYKYNKN